MVQLVISTGGKGERLLPLTKNILKPMVKIVGKPVLHHLVEWAKNNEFKEIIMLNGHMANEVINYFKDGKKFGIDIKHSTELHPLGSGGAIKFAKPFINDTFVYVNGDTVCDIDLKKMLEFHKNNKAEITILAHESSHPEDSDIIEIDKNGRATKFVSKHEDHKGAGKIGNSGLCIMEPEIFDLMQQEIFTLETYLYPKILENGVKMMVYQSDEFIHDMGTPERLKKCEEYLKSK